MARMVWRNNVRDGVLAASGVRVRRAAGRDTSLRQRVARCAARPLTNARHGARQLDASTCAIGRPLGACASGAASRPSCYRPLVVVGLGINEGLHHADELMGSFFLARCCAVMHIFCSVKLNEYMLLRTSKQLASGKAP